ncbi:MAG TPA: cupin domain-containing protein [Polyangiales bacterium]
MRHSIVLAGLLLGGALGCASAPAPTCPYPPMPAGALSGAAQAPEADAGAVDAAADAQAPDVDAAIQQQVSSIVFRPAPAGMPPGVELAVLEGDPKADGIFTLRLKAPPGFLLPPHTHPVDERVTVISGSVSVGFGSTVQKEQARAFPAGSFYVNPPGVPHYVFSDTGAIVQITGTGPWKVEPVTSSAQK